MRAQKNTRNPYVSVALKRNGKGNARIFWTMNKSFEYFVDAHGKLLLGNEMAKVVCKAI